MRGANPYTQPDSSLNSLTGIATDEFTVEDAAQLAELIGNGITSSIFLGLKVAGQDNLLGPEDSGFWYYVRDKAARPIWNNTIEIDPSPNFDGGIIRVIDGQLQVQQPQRTIFFGNQPVASYGAEGNFLGSVEVAPDLVKAFFNKLLEFSPPSAYELPEELSARNQSYEEELKALIKERWNGHQDQSTGQNVGFGVKVGPATFKRVLFRTDNPDPSDSSAQPIKDWELVIVESRDDSGTTSERVFLGGEEVGCAVYGGTDNGGPRTYQLFGQKLTPNDWVSAIYQLQRLDTARFLRISSDLHPATMSQRLSGG